MRVLIIGHSFIRRLQGFMKEHDKDPKFNVTEVQAIEWLFRGGLTLEHIWDSFSSRPTSILAKALRKFRPTHVYLEIGTNELKTATHNEACAIQAYISDCVQWVLARGVRCVILGKIILWGQIRVGPSQFGIPIFDRASWARVMGSDFYFTH